MEDTEVTIPEIREVFGDRIADAVALFDACGRRALYGITGRRSERIRWRGRWKLADLTHNMDIRRIKNPRQKDYDRIERKYKPAYAYLKGLE